jgi:hypothetical protein
MAAAQAISNTTCITRGGYVAEVRLAGAPGVTTLSHYRRLPRTGPYLHGYISAARGHLRTVIDGDGWNESTSQAEYAGSIPVIGSTRAKLVFSCCAGRRR